MQRAERLRRAYLDPPLVTRHERLRRPRRARNAQLTEIGPYARAARAQPFHDDVSAIWSAGGEQNTRQFEVARPPA